MEFKSEAIQKFYLKHKNKNDIENIIDFLNEKFATAKELRISYLDAMEQSIIWHEKTSKKIEALSQSKNVEKILEFDNNFSLVKLLNLESRKWEGHHMGHCIATYTTNEGFYSIRDKNNIPKVTFQIYNNLINQIKGKSNSKVADKYMTMVHQAIDYFNMKIRPQELSYINYTSDFDPQFFKEYFKNITISKIGGEEYLYLGNQIELIKPFPKQSDYFFQKLCKWGFCPQAIALCLEQGIDDPSIINEGFIWACHNGDLDLAGILFSKTKFRAVQEECLQWAALKGNLTILKFLESKGANLHFKNEFIFRWACRYQYNDIAEYLIAKRCLIGVRNFEAFRWAVEFNNEAMIKKLLTMGALIFNDKPLYRAIEYNNYSLCEFYIKEFHCTVKTNQEINPLLISLNKDFKIFKLLLENKLPHHNIHKKTIDKICKYGLSDHLKLILKKNLLCQEEIQAATEVSKKYYRDNLVEILAQKNPS